MSDNVILSPGSTFGGLSRYALDAVKGKWPVTIGACVLACVIKSAASQVPLAGLFAGLFLAPLDAGVILFFLKLIRRRKTPIECIFDPFSDYWRYVWGVVRVGLIVLAWTLLLIVPGIIAAIQYSMTLYIMVDHPDYDAKTAMRESAAIMYGHKAQYFGYSLLIALIALPVTIFTLGIGLFWLIPWAGVFTASFYESVRRRDEFEQLTGTTPGVAAD